MCVVGHVRDPTSNPVATSHTVTPTSISSSRDIGATATSPTVTAVLVSNTEDTTNTKHGIPATPMKPTETVPHVIKSRQNRGGGNSTGDNFPGVVKNAAPVMGLAPALVTLHLSIRHVWQVVGKVIVGTGVG